MNKKGFTLIELLAVIVILAIIALIAIPIILSIIKDTKLKSYEISLSQIEHSGDLYHIENPNTTTFNLENGKLVNELGDILTFDGDLGETSGIRITKSGNIYTYYYKDGYCTLKRGLNSEVEQFKTDKSLCNIDVATNLVKNGYGEYKDNTNFNKVTYENGVFKYTSSKYELLTSKEYIKIDTNKRYYFSTTIMTDNSNSSYYVGSVPYDIDKNVIDVRNSSSINNTLTYLTQDLKDGDNTVYLNDVSNFIDNSNSKGLIFWNYKDSTGYEYPPETYSRNVWVNLYDYSNINFEEKTITLKSTWDGVTIKEGTLVSQSTAGSAYNYQIFLNRTFEANKWVKGEGYMQGIKEQQVDNQKNFKAGTRYITWLSLNNYNLQPNVTTHYKDIIIREVEE